MVVFSGYENFVSRLNVEGASNELSWIGRMDVESLKNKVFVSVVSISTIHLLGVFMESKSIPDDKIFDVYRLTPVLCLHGANDAST